MLLRKRHVLTLALALCVVGECSIPVRSAETYQVGQHVQGYYINRKTGVMEWRSAVVEDVTNWGAHIRFDDDHEYQGLNFSALRPTPANDGKQNTVRTGTDAPNMVQSGIERRDTSATSQPPQIQPNAASQHPAQPKSRGCACDPGVAQAPASNASLEQVFKHAIYEDHATEIGTANAQPGSIGVTFQTFEIGKPIQNGQGGGTDGKFYQMLYPNVPPGGLVYPVHTKHILCRVYGGGGQSKTIIDGHYICFKDRFGKWVTATAEGHRIVGYE